jgi:hypothetical protein
MRYYDVPRHWTKRIIPHLGDRELNEVLVRDFNKYTYGRWEKRFTAGQYPQDFDPDPWFMIHSGPRPRYLRYTCSRACHWLVNFNLRMANLAEPKRPWRILRSDQHSTVWDGDQTLFELNFLALRVPPWECFQLACWKEHPVGKYRRVYYARYWKDEVAEHQSRAASA